MRRFALMMCSLASLSAAVKAADGPVLEVIHGDIYVSAETGFVKAEGHVSVLPGQDIVLKDSATAIISDAESGCFLSLRKGGSYRVPNFADCHQGSAVVLPTQLQITPTNGAVYPPPPVEVGITPFVASGAFVATIVAAATYTTLEKDAVSGP